MFRAQRTRRAEDPLSIYTATFDTVIHDTPWTPTWSHSSLHKPWSACPTFSPRLCAGDGSRHSDSISLHTNTGRNTTRVENFLWCPWRLFEDFRSLSQTQTSSSTSTQSSITSSLSQYTQSLLYPSSALQVLGFIITILIHLLSSTSLI